jgi:hypothetical protein
MDNQQSMHHPVPAAQVILYTFPAICWAYGAGFVFSAFVSVVFWGGPALRLLELVRLHSATVRPSMLTPASEVNYMALHAACAAVVYSY